MMPKNQFRRGMSRLLWTTVVVATVCSIAWTGLRSAPSSPSTNPEITVPGQDSKARSSRRVCTDAILPEVRWLDADSALVVQRYEEERYWYVRIAKDSRDSVIQIQRIPLSPDNWLVVALTGDAFALFDEVKNQIRISRNLRDWGVPFSPPPLSHLFPKPLERPKEERVQLYWMNNTSLVIRRSNFASTAFACAVFDIRKKRWKLIDSCPDLGDIIGDLVTIVPVADDVFAVGTSAEGVTGISVVRIYGGTVTPIAELPLGNGVQGYVERYGAAAGTLIVSSHVLNEMPARLSLDSCWQLYAWNLKDGSLSLMRAGLPREARLRPGKDDEWLWPTEDGELCLGDPDSKAECAALPKD